MELLKKLPMLGKMGIFGMACLMLFTGTAAAAIVMTLAAAITSDGTVSEPFTAEVTAVSVGTIDDPNTVSGANTVAGSAAETFTLGITNNANQGIDAWLEISCGSADDSLTSDYINLEFDGAAPQYNCDDSNIVYNYRSFNEETFAAGATDAPVVSYEFPITATGYFTGDYTCSANVVTVKAC